MIGDSRIAQAFGPGNNGAAGAAGSFPYNAPAHAFNVANFINGSNLTLVGNYGISGYRSDQYFATNLAACLAVRADYLFIGAAAVNDIAQANAGYTTISGVAVTNANVAAIAAANVQAAIAQALARGLRVIVQSEPGSSSLFSVAAQYGAVFEYNERMRDFIEDTPGVAWFDPNSTIWNPVSSTTAIAFAAGVSSDGTHRTTLGGYLEGQALATFLATFIPAFDARLGNVADGIATNAYSILPNPAFGTLTGGTTGANIVLTSGTVPASWTISSGLASTSVIITNPTDPTGSGTNAVKLALTFGAADTFNFVVNIGTSNWNLTDILQAGISASVDAGSSNCLAFLTLQTATSGGASTNGVMSQLNAAGAGLVTAYAGTFKTPKFPVASLTGSKNYVQIVFNVKATAAGSMAITLSRPYIRRRIS
jgi:hypothetical protein